MDSQKNAGTNRFVDIDPIKLLFSYLHRWWVFVICGVLGLAIAMVYTKYFITPTYVSSVSLYVNGNRSGENTQYASSGDISFSRTLVSTYMAIAKSDKVMTAVSEELGGRYSAGFLKGRVSVSQVNNTELFTVSVTTSDPQESANIANAIAIVLPRQMAEVVEGTSAQIIDYAQVPTWKSSPNDSRNAMIGLMLGLVLAAAIVTVEYLLDVRIKETEDIAAICEYPILGQIPDFDTLSTKDRSAYAYQSQKK